MMITRLKLKQYIAIAYLILMSTQYILIEGLGVSNLKFAAMCFAPIIWVSNFKVFSKAFVAGGIFIIFILFSTLYNFGNFRLSTVVYKISFVMMFVAYYDLVYHNNIFSIDEFINLIKKFIIIFFGFLILQQIVILAGFQSLPIINYVSFVDRGVGSNSLTLEPSHTARLLTVFMLALLRMYEIKRKHSVLLVSEFFRENKYVVLAFLWMMISMGSGTAFAGLAILLLYFMKIQYSIVISSIFIIFYLSIPYIDFKPFNRARDIVQASISLDQQRIIDADESAASRILPFFNTFNSFDYKDTETWLGNGTDIDEVKYLSKDHKISHIVDYGLICYLVSIIFYLICCSHKIFSLENLIFIVLMATSINNIAYVWGILMIFTTSNFFIKNATRLNGSDLRL